MSRNISCALHLARDSHKLHYNPIRSIHDVKIVGKRTEGERNMRKHSSNPSSTAYTSFHPEFNPKRDMKLSADTKSGPGDGDCAPFDGASGENSRCGMHSVEYLVTEKKGELYSIRGGDYRYGGRQRYEWRRVDLERVTPE